MKQYDDKYIDVDGDGFDFLIGKSIKEVKDDTLICTDGTTIQIETNEGCEGCCNGWSSLDDLEILEHNNNIITDVKCDYHDSEEFTLFIYYEDGSINELEGNDGYGNGYYGGGFHVNIKRLQK